MDIKMKAALATVTDTSANAEEFPGTFEVELSNETLDRDGDTLKAEDWETPLPDRITFVNDHTHKMASVVGSAVPELVDGRILCKGTWARDKESQDTRAKIEHVPYTSVAYAEKSNGKRELINGAFVVVPSNKTTRVLASKSVTELDEDTPIGELTIKQFKSLLDTQELPENTKGAPAKVADSQADSAEDQAAALARTKAAAIQIINETR